MALSNELISQFVKVTQDKEETKKESTAYGKIVESNGVKYVQLDGSELLTPIETTTVVHDEDRVMVTIKNHMAVVTGDFTNPSANNKDVVNIGNKITEFEIVIADKVTTEQLEAEIAKIDKLIADEIDAVNGKFETIDAKVAEIDTIKAEVVEIDGKVTAHEGEFTTIRADIAEFVDVTVGELNAIDGEFRNLKSDYASFESTITNTLTAYEADIKDLTANSLTVDKADLRYANIDFSNIGEAAIEKLFTDSGIIKDLIMSDGKVTGELVGVTIKGDIIEGNTVKADKLVILGEDGIYYKLNVDALGEATASSDEKYQNGLDGSVIIAESITAEKIAVDDLVAFGATIGGFHIDNHAIYSGVKNSVDNTTQGVFLGDDGQMNFGDLNNFFKFYVDEDGKYKLEIQADTIRFGANNTNIADVTLDTTAIYNEIYAQKTDIIATTEALILQATADYVKTGDLETFQETVKAQLEVMAEDVTLKFTQNSSDIKDLQDTTSSEFETIKKYFQFNEDGMTMGSGESAIKLSIDNDDGIIFSKNGETFGYWDGNDFYTGNIVVRTNERAQFGKYAYVPRSDGSLMFLKVK